MLRAAAGHVDITPPVGTELAGWCFGASTGIADRLCARALVLDDGRAPLALITMDLIGLGTPEADRVRSEVAARLGTSRDRVLVSCSHTHSGPGAMPLRRWGGVDPAYLAQTLDSVVAMVEACASRLEPAGVAVGEGVVHGICSNRRGDRGNVVDERLPVLTVRGARGTPVAIVYNYSCHPVAAHNDRNLISADFPGYSAESIAARYPRAEPLFTLGAAGDVNPVEFHRLDLARSYGGVIGAAVVEVVETSLGVAGTESTPGAGLTPDGTAREATSDTVQIQVASRAVDLPVAPLPSAGWLRDERDRWAREAERLRESDGPHSKVEDALIKSEWAAEALGVVEAGSARTHLEMEITAVRVGELVLVAMPGELFVEIGMRIKDASPFRYTAIVELANGSIAYLPTAEAYRKGGYETDFSAKVYGLYHLTDATQAIIEDVAGDLLRELAGRSASTSNRYDTEEDFHGNDQ